MLLEFVRFANERLVRHPLIGTMLKKSLSLSRERSLSMTRKHFVVSEQSLEHGRIFSSSEENLTVSGSDLCGVQAQSCAEKTEASISDATSENRPHYASYGLSHMTCGKSARYVLWEPGAARGILATRCLG